MTIARTYTFSDGTAFSPSKLEVELSNLANTLNNFNNGTIAWNNFALYDSNGRKITFTIVYDSGSTDPLLKLT